MSLEASAPQYDVTLGPAVLEPPARTQVTLGPATLLPTTQGSSAAPLLAGLSLAAVVWIFASTLNLGRQ